MLATGRHTLEKTLRKKMGFPRDEYCSEPMVANNQYALSSNEIAKAQVSLPSLSIIRQHCHSLILGHRLGHTAGQNCPA
jgi:hypothetical protein